jgi:serine/threonine protein kinase, bacterial
MIGQLLAGRYRVLQVLGAGGFGQTYITEDLHLPGQPKCVLKHLRPATNRPDVLTLARQLFQKEAETLQQLGNHDRIPRLLAYFEENQEFYLVQDYVVGHTLAYEMVSGQKWTEAALYPLLQEILEILEFVHGQGVIHRDIKPDNLMRRDADGKLVLIDFGAIKQVRNQQFTQMGTAQQTVAIGTVGYMAPEQAHGNPRPSSDIYALGMIGIQAITGCYPTEFAEDDRTGELQWQQYAQANPATIDLLQKMTRYHFRDRYPNASAVLQDLKFQAPTFQGFGSLPTVPFPQAYNPSAMPTQVVAPLRPVTPGTPAPQPAMAGAQPTFKPKILTDPRLEQPKSKKPWLLWLAVLGTSGAAGYLLLPKVIPSNLNVFNSFDRRIASDLCRLAAPTTRDNMTKIRAQPDRTAAIAASIPKGEKLLEVSKQEPFVQIERQDGSKGWVFNNQIDSCSGVSIKPSDRPSPIDSPKPSATRSTTPTVRRATSSSPIAAPSITPSSIVITPSISIGTSSPSSTPQNNSPSSVAPSPNSSANSAPSTSSTTAPVPPSPPASIAPSNSSNNGSSTDSDGAGQ